MNPHCCINDLRNKQVINICDGRCLGYVCDVQINTCDGKLVAIIVPGENKGFLLTKCDEMTIPWDRIERIGDDTILVNVGELRPPCNDNCKKKRKFFWD